MATNVVKLPFALPENVQDESFVLALDRNFKAIERALGSLQIYMNTTGYDTIYNAQTFISQLGGLSVILTPTDATYQLIAAEAMPSGYLEKHTFVTDTEQTFDSLGASLTVSAPVGAWANVQYSVVADTWLPVVLGRITNLGTASTYKLKADRNCTLLIKNTPKALAETYLVAGFHSL